MKIKYDIKPLVIRRDLVMQKIKSRATDTPVIIANKKAYNLICSLLNPELKEKPGCHPLDYSFYEKDSDVQKGTPYVFYLSRKKEEITFEGWDLIRHCENPLTIYELLE